MNTQQAANVYYGPSQNLRPLRKPRQSHTTERITNMTPFMLHKNSNFSKRSIKNNKMSIHDSSIDSIKDHSQSRSPSMKAELPANQVFSMTQYSTV